MIIKTSVAAAIAGLGLWASAAHASTLIYSTSGVVGQGASPTILQASVSLPDGYANPAVVDPTSSDFRGTDTGPTQTYIAVLKTTAPFANFSTYDIAGHDNTYLTHAALGQPATPGWVLASADDIDSPSPAAPTMSGTTYVWEVTGNFSQTVSGCLIEDWSNCSQINDLLTQPNYLDVDLAFTGGEGAAYSLQVFAGGVPEPGAWVMMIGGLGLTGGMMRMRRDRLGAARKGKLRSLP